MKFEMIKIRKLKSDEFAIKLEPELKKYSDMLNI